MRTKRITSPSGSCVLPYNGTGSQYGTCISQPFQNVSEYSQLSENGAHHGVSTILFQGNAQKQYPEQQDQLVQKHCTKANMATHAPHEINVCMDTSLVHPVALLGYSSELRNACCFKLRVYTIEDCRLCTMGTNCQISSGENLQNLLDRVNNNISHDVGIIVAISVVHLLQMIHMKVGFLIVVKYEKEFILCTLLTEAIKIS